MTSMVVVAILSLCGTMFGSIAGIMTANRLTTYRISQLEEKVDKHNNVVERVALLELDEKNQWKRLDELKETIEHYHE
jgi:hypothetical protein